MKFAPEHQPLTMTGVASIAGLAVFMMVFLFTTMLITAPGVPPTAGASAGAGIDPSVARGVVAGLPDTAARAIPPPIRPAPPLMESVRASLLAAAGAAEYRRAQPQSTAPAVRPRKVTDPRARSVPPRAAKQKSPAVKPRVVTPGKVNGSVAMGSIQWIGGGRRKKVSGPLPAFPPGVASNVLVKVEAVVAPDGRVRSVRPGQKGNAKCEEAAIRAVQRWRFDRLVRSTPQRDQRCVVSFTFTANRR